MLEVVMVSPQAYHEDNKTVQRAADDYLGGFDGVLMRLYADEVAKNGHEAVDARIAQEGSRLVQAAGGDSEKLKFQLGYRRSLLGMSFMAGKLSESIDAMQKLAA